MRPEPNGLASYNGFGSNEQRAMYQFDTEIYFLRNSSISACCIDITDMC